jgi:hypothetical protein
MRLSLSLLLLLSVASCKKEAAPAAAAETPKLSVGLVTDVGGRGD